MKKLIIMMCTLTASIVATAEWEKVYSTNPYDISPGNWQDKYRTCSYNVPSIGEDITIRIKQSSTCPSSIDYDPETGSWRR